jgi:uncharacterized membrane protein HdeD (DUF308 family)
VSAASRESSARRTITLGAVCAVLGIGLTGSASPTLGAVFLVVGWMALVVGIHRFGRSATD